MAVDVDIVVVAAVALSRLQHEAHPMMCLIFYSLSEICNVEISVKCSSPPLILLKPVFPS